MSAASVLIVEDHSFVRDLIGRLLVSLSVARVASVASAEEALSGLEADPGGVDVALVDHELPGMSGVRLIETLRASLDQRLRKLPVVMLTGHNDLALYRDAARLGISAFLVKPVGPRTLKSALEDAVAGRRVAVPGPG